MFPHTHTTFKIFPQASFHKLSVQFSTDLLFLGKKKGAVCKKVLLGPFLLARLPPLQPDCAEPVEFHLHRGLFVSVLAFYFGFSSTVSWVCKCACHLCFVILSAVSLPLP